MEVVERDREERGTLGSYLRGRKCFFSVGGIALISEFVNGNGGKVR
jgi:hypothetical protein